MDASDVCSWFALAISLSAAVFAERSATSAESAARSAKLANDIDLHKDRLLIYKALQKFHFQILTQGNGFTDDAIWPFADAANLSEFYFPKVQHVSLLAIVNSALEFRGIYETWKEMSHGTAKTDKYSIVTKAGAALREQCIAADKDLRAQLRLDGNSFG